jgi:hypothetical protein
MDINEWVEMLHEQKQYRPESVAVLYNERGEFLFINPMVFPNIISLPQRGIELGEDYVTAFMRGVHEEIGIDGSDLTKAIIGFHSSLVDYYEFREEFDALRQQRRDEFPNGKAYICTLAQFNGELNLSKNYVMGGAHWLNPFEIIDSIWRMPISEQKKAFVKETIGKALELRFPEFAQNLIPSLECTKKDYDIFEQSGSLRESMRFVNGFNLRSLELYVVDMFRHVGEVLYAEHQKLSSDGYRLNMYNSLDFKEIVRESTRYLAGSRNEGVLDKLLEIAQRSRVDTDVNEGAVYAIGQMRNPKALPILTKMLESNYMPPRIGSSHRIAFLEDWAVKDALLNIGGTDVLPLFDKYVDPAHNDHLLTEQIWIDFGNYGGRRELDMLQNIYGRDKKTNPYHMPIEYLSGAIEKIQQRL